MRLWKFSLGLKSMPSLTQCVTTNRCDGFGLGKTELDTHRQASRYLQAELAVKHGGEHGVVLCGRRVSRNDDA